MGADPEVVRAFGEALVIANRAVKHAPSFEGPEMARLREIEDFAQAEGCLVEALAERRRLERDASVSGD